MIGRLRGSRVDLRGLFGFLKKERIRRPQDFRKGMKFGRRVSSRSFTVYTLKKRDPPIHRLGIIVKKEIGPATYRNRIKRYCREFFRLHKQEITEPIDIIVFVKKGCAIRRYQEAEEELERLLTPGPPLKREILPSREKQG